MTLRTGTTIEAESLEQAITELNLEHVFETVTGTPLTKHSSTNTSELPHETLRTVLSAAPTEFYLETPELGSEPRFRITQF